MNAGIATRSVLDGRQLIGWQTLLADLALILFMVTAAAMTASPSPAAKAPPLVRTAPADAPRAEPAAVWRAGGTAPSLGVWLRQSAPDPRQQLTIRVHYAPAPAALGKALARAASLAGQADGAGVRARVLVEPGADEAFATLGYDRMGQAGTKLAE